MSKICLGARFTAANFHARAIKAGVARLRVNKAELIKRLLRVLSESVIFEDLARGLASAVVVARTTEKFNHGGRMMKKTGEN